MIMGLTWTHLESLWNPSGPSEVPLLYKPVTGQELFFAISYSKPALNILIKEFCTTFFAFTLCLLSFSLYRYVSNTVIHLQSSLFNTGLEIKKQFNRAKKSPTTSGYPVISSNWTFCGPGYQSRSL